MQECYSIGVSPLIKTYGSIICVCPTYSIRVKQLEKLIIYLRRCWGLGQSQVNTGHKITKSTLINIGKSQSKSVKQSQGWSNEVKSYMRRPKDMEKGNPMSKYNFKVKSSGFEAKMAKTTGVEQVLWIT